MAEEHAEMQMIQHGLDDTPERKHDNALGKICRLRTTDEGPIGIKIPPLNMALVEVHHELATMLLP